MRYINQLKYPHIPYHTNVKNPEVSEERRLTNVARSGCGLCCVCMMLDVLTEECLSVEDCMTLAEDCVANHAPGTDMTILGPVVAEKFGINYSNTSSLEEAIRHLQCGGQVIAHVGIPIGKNIALFTNSSHFILLTSTDGEKFCILDPSYTPEKYAVPERAGRVDLSHAPFLYCDVNTVYSEGDPGKIFYHLFSRKSD